MQRRFQPTLVVHRKQRDNLVVVPEDGIQPPPRWQLGVRSVDPPLLLQRFVQSRRPAEFPVVVCGEIHYLWLPALCHSDDQYTKAVRPVAEASASECLVNVHHNSIVFEVLKD